jgi:hypothetical protein
MKPLEVIGALVGFTISSAVVGLAMWYFSFWANAEPIFDLGPMPLIVGGAMIGFVISLVLVVRELKFKE